MKQKIEIDVPDGMKAIYKDNKIEFVPIKKCWSDIKTFDQAFKYLCDYLPECHNLIDSYHNTLEESYEHKVICYRIIVSALTNNEQRHLATGKMWYPVIQFCNPEEKKRCYGKIVIGTIESEGIKYTVIGGEALDMDCGGLGYFDPYDGVSLSTSDIGFRSVSSEEIAKHISTYFGKLLFEVLYYGTNCDWKWVED